MVESLDTSLVFSFDLPLSRLHVVDSDLSELQEVLCCECPLILGIDTETKPTFTSWTRKLQPTALIQIAVRSAVLCTESVFIVDLLTMRKDSRLMEQLDIILQTVFLDKNVIKFGQGLRQDFQELRSNYPTMQAFKVVNSILDTNVLHRHLKPEEIRDLGLKAFTQQYLHFDLDKSCQMSNWALRPLTFKQVHYAACDSLVLLRLFDVMTCEAEEKGGFDLHSVLRTFGGTTDNMFSPKRQKSSDSQKNITANDSMDTQLRFNFYSTTEKLYYDKCCANPQSTVDMSADVGNDHVHFVSNEISQEHEQTDDDHRNFASCDELSASSSSSYLSLATVSTIASDDMPIHRSAIKRYSQPSTLLYKYSYQSQCSSHGKISGLKKKKRAFFRCQKEEEEALPPTLRCKRLSGSWTPMHRTAQTIRSQAYRK